MTDIKRSKLQIDLDILALAKRGAQKTRLMYRGNFSFGQLNEKLYCLTKAGLLTTRTKGEARIFVTTDKGEEFLEKSKYTSGILKEMEYYSEEFAEDPRPTNEKLNLLLITQQKSESLTTIASPTPIYAKRQ